MNTIRIQLAAISLLLPLAASAAVRLQVGHFAPLSSNVDATGMSLRINGQSFVANLKYGDRVGYQSIGGTAVYRVELVPAGSTAAFVVADISLNDNNDYTAIVIGNNRTQSLGLLFVLDNNTIPPAGFARLRVIHASPFASSVAVGEIAVRTAAGTTLPGMERVPYASPTTYVQLSASTYEMKVTNPDGAQTLLNIAPAALASASITNWVFAGDGVAQPFAAFSLAGGSGTTEPLVDQGASGAWTTGNASGQGISFYAMPSENRLLGSWFTYTTTGQPRWFTLDSCGSQPGSGTCSNPRAFNNRRAVLTVYETSGGRYLASDPVALRIVGTLSVDFASCANAHASYTIDGQSGQFDLVNFVPTPNCTIR